MELLEFRESGISTIFYIHKAAEGRLVSQSGSAFGFSDAWANYQENSVKDLLNYRFGMVKAGLDFRFPHEWSLNFGLEYDFLHSQESGDQMFDAVVPSFGVQKIFVLSNRTFLMLNGGIRYSLTENIPSRWKESLRMTGTTYRPPSGSV